MIVRLYLNDYKKMFINYNSRDLAFTGTDETVERMYSMLEKFELRFYTDKNDLSKCYIYRDAYVERIINNRVVISYGKYHSPTPAEIRAETRAERLEKLFGIV